MKTAEEWLKQLSSTLASTQCKVSGVRSDLALGLKAFQQLIKDKRQAGASVWWVGNGGSAAMCSHLSQDMLNKLKVRSQVLSDTPLITCMANDFGYAEVYARPLSTLVRKGDLVIAISSSGKSANILACAELARQKELSLVTLSAFSAENPLWNFSADVSFYLSSSLYGIVEVGHEAILHSAIETLWLEETSQPAQTN